MNSLVDKMIQSLKKMPDTELQLLKLDMEYTKKAVADLDKKVDIGFNKTNDEITGLRSDFLTFMQKQENLLLEISNKNVNDLISVSRDFDAKLNEKPSRAESWGESAIKWFIVTLGVLIVGYAFKVIISHNGALI